MQYSQIPVWPIQGKNQEMQGSRVHTIQKGQRFSQELGYSPPKSQGYSQFIFSLIIQYRQYLTPYNIAYLMDDQDRHRFTSVDISQEEGEESSMPNFYKIMQNNREWAQQCIKNEPDFFSKLVKVQIPKYLWIGCSDSRVPANEIMGLKPGQVFVHRNVANIAPPSDINVLAVIQYAVEYLKVEDIIVAGHYGCGGIKAAFQQNDFGPLQSWLSHIRQIRSKFRQSLIGSQIQKQRTLVELNVRQQVINISRIPAVQKIWIHSPERKLTIHGVVYNLQDGILKDLGLTMDKLSDVPGEYRLSKSIPSTDKS